MHVLEGTCVKEETEREATFRQTSLRGNTNWIHEPQNSSLSNGTMREIEFIRCLGLQHDSRNTSGKRTLVHRRV